MRLTLPPIWRSPVCVIRCDPRGPPNKPERAYGIGIGIDHGWLGHTGELPGYNCSAYYLPDKKAVIVVMVNTDIPSGKNNPAPTIMKALTQVVTPGNVPE